MGLRERHRIDKLQRITTAAINLFGRHGYDGPTMRDIARDADVALGTLTLYARDKRDLILLIFSRLVPPLFTRGRLEAVEAESLVDAAVAFFKPCYVAYADEVTLFRVVLGQIYSGPSSVLAEENDAIRVEVLGHLADIIRRAIDEGRCRADVDVANQARTFFYIYFTAVRVWLFQDNPEPRQGLDSLRMLFSEHIRGMAIGT